MDPKYLLDTNICIYIRQNRPEQVMSRFRRLRPGEAALSVITFGELIYGANKSAQRLQALQRLRDLATLVPALPLPETAAETLWFDSFGFGTEGRDDRQQRSLDRSACSQLGPDAGHE